MEAHEPSDKPRKSTSVFNQSAPNSKKHFGSDTNETLLFRVRKSTGEYFSMAETNITIHEQQFYRIKSILARLHLESAARLVFLIDRDGQPIAFHGDTTNVDTTGFASLAAGNVAATNGMAKLIGESSFPTLSHEGERDSIYISVVGRTLLAVIFDDRSTLGLVKLRARKAGYELAELLVEVARVAEENRAVENAMFAEITDEDIDSLFG